MTSGRKNNDKENKQILSNIDEDMMRQMIMMNRKLPYDSNSTFPCTPAFGNHKG